MEPWRGKGVHNRIVGMDGNKQPVRQRNPTCTGVSCHASHLVISLFSCTPLHTTFYHTEQSFPNKAAPLGWDDVHIHAKLSTTRVQRYRHACLMELQRKHPRTKTPLYQFSVMIPMFQSKSLTPKITINILCKLDASLFF